MTYLLDTHALLWALNEPAALGGQARTVITDPATELWVSAASAWEIATKRRVGKLPGSDVLVSGYRNHLARLQVHSLDITSEHALLAGSLDWSHRDPFDRMLAAQCMVESLSLITKDPAFAGLGGVRTVW